MRNSHAAVGRTASGWLNSVDPVVECHTFVVLQPPRTLLEVAHLPPDVAADNDGGVGAHPRRPLHPTGKANAFLLAGFCSRTRHFFLVPVAGNMNTAGGPEL